MRPVRIASPEVGRESREGERERDLRQRGKEGWRATGGEGREEGEGLGEQKGLLL